MGYELLFHFGSKFQRWFMISHKLLFHMWKDNTARMATNHPYVSVPMFWMKMSGY